MTFLADATIEGGLVSVQFGDAIRSASETLSIDQAPTVTIALLDPDGSLIQSELWQQRSRLKLGGRTYILVQVEKQGQGQLTATFEQWEVYKLRQRTKYRKAYRSRIDRVTFAQSLCRESGIKFHAPEAGPPPPPYQKTTDSADTTQGAKSGFDRGAKLKIGPSPPNKVQRDALTAALGEAVRLTKGYGSKARDLILTGMVMAGIQESTWVPKLQEHGGSNHWGLFQQNTGAYTRPERGDPVQAAHEFLCGSGTWQELPWGPKTDQPTGGHSFLKAMRGWTGKDRTLGDMVELTQGAGLGGGPYDQWHAQAAAIVRAYHDPGWTGTRVRTLLNDKFEFSRGTPGRPETSWDALQRLAEEIGWRCFMVGDTVWFVSDDWLMGTAPQATLREGDGVVNSLSWTIDVGKTRDECDAAVNESWIYSPGVVVRVDGEGPADGKWLLAEWARDLVRPVATLRLVKPGATLPEPVGDQSGDGFKKPAGRDTSLDDIVLSKPDANLAHALTSDKRVVWANSSFRNDFWHAAEVINGQTWMDLRVLQVVQMILDRGYHIRISSAISTHPVGVNGLGPKISNHKYGGCTDIDWVNGAAVSINNRVAKELFDWLHTISPRPEELLSPWADDGHHKNHIHCGFKEVGKRRPYLSSTPRFLGPF